MARMSTVSLVASEPSALGVSQATAPLSATPQNPISQQAVPQTGIAQPGIAQSVAVQATVPLTCESISPWATVRFRRSPTEKGWALLGIPTPLYPLIVHRLFENQARLLGKYEQGDFVSIQFEAPMALAATLATTFPAPPGCDALAVSAAGDRILSGQAALSPRVRRQAIQPAGAAIGDDIEGFWATVYHLAHRYRAVAHKPSDRP